MNKSIFENLPKNILIQISLEYSLPELLNFCRSSSKINDKICNNQLFWMKKLNKDFGIYKHQSIPEIYKMEKNKLEKDYKKYYKFITDRLKYSNNNINRLLVDGSELGDLNIVKYALNKGADINNNPGDGTALFGAVKYNNLEIVKFLIKSGAEIGENDLNVASTRGHLDIVKYLIGFDTDHNYDSSLILASINGHLDIVKFLVESGADVHADYDEALNMGNYYMHYDVAKYLISVM